LGSAVKDRDGRPEQFLTELEAAAIIVRPDFYVYGSAQSANDLQSLASDLLRDLAAHGVAVADIEGGCAASPLLEQAHPAETMTWQ